MTKEQLIEYLKQQAVEAGGQKILAERLEVSQAYLSDVINGRREPADKLLSALRMEQVVTYRFVNKQ